MLLRRKISFYLGIAMIFIMFITGTNSVYAVNAYTLEAREILSDNTEVDYPLWTGLLINEIDKKGDRRLAEALESELTSYGLDTNSLPLKIDYSHSECLPPVGRQYENSCVGWSTGYYLRTYQQAKDIGWAVKNAGSGISSHVFSPSFIYNQIRQENEKTDDAGAYISDAGSLLKNMGVASLEDFPYIPYDIYTLPDQADIQNAYPHRIREWRLLYSGIDSDSYIIQKTKEYLNTGDLVVAGNKIGDDFLYNLYEDQYGNSIITLENNPPYMHAFVIVGYDDTLITPDGIGAFKLVNSWGTAWGDGGFSYISYRAFAAGALEGYVFTDILNAQAQELPVDINDSVVFNMNFAGSGRYDIKVKTVNDQLVYEKNNLQGKPGINSLEWNGRDMAGNLAADGVYKLNIIPYSGETPKPTFSSDFNKSGRVTGASAQAYSYDNVIQYVNILITFKSNCFISIKVDYNGEVHEVIPAWPVLAGESDTYTIHKSDFDFNNKDLTKVKIVIDAY